MSSMDVSDILAKVATEKYFWKDPVHSPEQGGPGRSNEAQRVVTSDIAP